MSELGHTVTLERGAESERAGFVETALLYVAMRCGEPASGASRHALRGVDVVCLGRGARLEARREIREGKRALVLTLPDRSVSSDHARIERDGAGHQLRDMASKNGTVVDGVKVDAVSLRDGALIELGEMLLVYRNPVLLGEGEPVDLVSRDIAGPEGVVTLVPRLSRQFDALRKVAASQHAVMIHGESGTGKEVVARAVHTLSGRRGDFVAVNCGALSDTLLQGQLFGYKRGAFSGATEDRRGLVEASDGGTLFLDEIAELSPQAQASLLRVLQEHEVLALGATAPVRVDLRLVVATHRDLEAMVEEETFREDLYARITGLHISLLPLRERREDLGLLVAQLLARDGGRAQGLTVRAARALFRYHWPRNIRELDKCLYGAATLSDGSTIGSEHLPPELRSTRSIAPEQAAALSSEDEALRRELVALLREHEGNVTRVADAMGKKRQQVQKWCKRLDINPRLYR